MVGILHRTHAQIYTYSVAYYFSRTISGFLMVRPAYVLIELAETYRYHARELSQVNGVASAEPQYSYFSHAIFG